MPKPSTLFYWTDGDAAKVTEPAVAKKDLGYTPSEKPSPFEFNWNLYNIGLWIEYLEEITDTLSNSGSIYDAIIGASGSYGTINDAMADMGVGLPAQDVKLLVVDPQTLNTTQVIDKEGVQIDFAPRANYAKGTANIGIQIDAERCRIKGGRFQNFSGGSDAAINLTANAIKCMIIENHFLNNNVEIESSAGSNNVITNNIVE